MKHVSFGAMSCPVARSLEHVGEWWSMLILRDALYGYKRFDEFEQSLGIAPSILAKRLKTLVEAGMLERRQYTAKPPRYEYLVTDRCRDFETVLHSLLAFGNRHFSPGERNVVIIDSRTGVEAEPVLIDGLSGRPLSDPRFRWAAGPAADAEVRRRYAKASA